MIDSSGARPRGLARAAFACGLMLTLGACGGGGSSGDTTPPPPGDTTAPSVASVTPVAGATGQSASLVLTATFSESLDCTALPAAAITVKEGSQVLGGSTTCDGATLTFTPAGELPTNATLDASIDATVADVAGNALGATYSWRFATRAWAVQGGSAGDELVAGLGTDGAGNLVLAGTTMGVVAGQSGVGGYDTYVIKFDRDGQALWRRQFGTSADDTVQAMAVDARGNIFVAGITDGTFPGRPFNSGTDAFIAKYDGNGNQLWLKQLQSSGSDSVLGLAVDPRGGIVAVGFTEGALFATSATGPSDLFVARLDDNGDVAWSYQTGNSGYSNLYGVQVNAAGEVYATGSTSGALGGNSAFGAADMVLLKFSATGAHSWTRQYGSARNDLPRGLALDSAGRPLVLTRTSAALLGQPYAGGGSDAHVTKFDAAGNVLWARGIGSAGDEFPGKIVLDADDNAYLIGSTNGVFAGQTAAGVPDAFVAKLDATGTLVWLRQWGTAGNDSSGGIAIDAAGHLVVAASSTGALDGFVNAGEGDYLLVKFAPDGVRR